MIGQLIKNYGEIGALGVFVIMMAWYLWHQTRYQSKREDKHDAIQREERLFYRDLVTNDLKELHQDSVRNADLNKKSIALQKSIAGKTISALNVICEKLNGTEKAVIKK